MFLLCWGVALFCVFAGGGAVWLILSALLLSALLFSTFCLRRGGLACPFHAFAGNGTA